MSRLGCDVLVVGGEICGLAAAALIAQHVGEQRVVVIDDLDAGVGLPLGDRLAPAAPSLFRLAGPSPHSDKLAAQPLLQSPVIRLLDELGIKQDARRFLGDAGGLGLFDDPDIRMVVPVDAQARARELTRVFGADVGERAAARLLDLHGDARAPLLAEAATIHERGFFASRRQRKRVQALGPEGQLDSPCAAGTALVDLPLDVVVEQLVPFVQTRGGAAPQGMAGLLAGLQLQAGGHGRARGGIGPRAAFAELLRDVIRRHRGDVVRAKVASVETDGRAVSAVHVTSSHTYTARVVIDATSCRDLTERLPAGQRRDKLARVERRVQLAGDAAAVRWLVPATALPRGIPPLGLILRAHAAGGAILVGIYTGAPLPEGSRGPSVEMTAAVVVAGTLCPRGRASEASEDLDRALDQLLPFAREQAIARDTVMGAPAQAVLQQWEVVESEHPLGGRRPQTPYKNLLRAGRDLVPGLGVDGELIAAHAVVALAEERLGLHRKSLLG